MRFLQEDSLFEEFDQQLKSTIQGVGLSPLKNLKTINSSLIHASASTNDGLKISRNEYPDAGPTHLNSLDIPIKKEHRYFQEFTPMTREAKSDLRLNYKVLQPLHFKMAPNWKK